MFSSMHNTETVPEGPTDMPVLQDMINDIRESSPFYAQTSSRSLSADDLLLNEALAFTDSTENNESSSIDVTDASSEKSSESLVDGLMSSSKCISLALNNQTPSVAPVYSIQSVESKPVQPISSPQTGTVEPIVIPPPEPVTTNAKVSPQKPHIMISYNRSCQEMCQRIRNNLKALKYIVWMDIYDMRNNFIDGMAKAIGNSYIVLMCLNQKYDRSFWCRKEAEDICIKQIKFIPCFMEDPYTPDSWLALLLGANIRIDFSNNDKFDESFKDLIKQISFIEEELATNPRESAPPTPTIVISPNSTIETFDTILHNFKTWVEDNRDNLKRFNRKQSARLINELIQSLEHDQSTSDDENKRELLQQLLSTTSQNQTDLLPRIVYSLAGSNLLAIKGLIFIMALWAVRVVFNKN
ncbi:hypothetical protein I4U23_023696 [Adineta vaga]|nr:hypothetical protein I4U23_023696 [Adineta vaga]